jgi:hypothetical protein
MAIQNKLVLPFVETMVTQACNLSCYGCTNYSDLKHQGYVTWNQGREQITPWLSRLEISDFGLIGGEPLINPEIRRWVTGIRELLPHAHLRFTTNGLLLEKHFDVVKLLSEIGNCVLKVSVHTPSMEVEQVISRILKEFNWRPIFKYGIHHYQTTNDFRFQVRRPDIFLKTYLGNYNNMRPHNSDPEKAFEMCCQQTCPLLNQGKLYKCSTTGLLKSTLERFNWPNRNEWEPYLVEGLTPQCGDDELSEFLKNFGNPAEICGQCPTKLDIGSTLNHVKFVRNKKELPFNE